VNSGSGLLLTTYEQLRIVREKLLDIEWGYAVLDEGHRIRNPNAEVTLVCKQLQTVHRIIMTGAPIQNKLSELWSLFDFVFPGKLGVLPVFETEFSVPITVGGYANATPLQVSTAYRCAVVLRDLIMPYLLRRMKADVNAQLPKKTEHVLFCSLTPEQRNTYRAFLASSEVEQIFDGNRNSLYGIDVLRKICNHPDLLEREHAAQNPDYGNPERSGKMKVVEQVLKVWKDQGHRVLLFAQTQQMLDILENFLTVREYEYRRMDGLTPPKQRMALIDEFNNTDEIFIFILTTKVGGLGTNLVGANRVIIFDPDWNPSTDMQVQSIMCPVYNYAHIIS
jgi:DNA excision repair protein ERCC-6